MSDMCGCTPCACVCTVSRHDINMVVCLFTSTDLRHHVNPADQDCAFDLDARAQRLKLLGNLNGQLARGG